MKILWCLLFFSFNSLGITESDLISRYQSDIFPYYQEYPINFFPYHDDKAKKFPFKLFTKNSKNLLVILPGKGEQIERYAETIFDLRPVDADILLLQFRGQGKASRALSDHEKAHIENFDDVVEDMHALFVKLNIRERYKKINLLAHSMGGHHGLRFQAKYGDFDEIILNSPLVGLFNERETLLNYYMVKVLDLIGLSNFYVPGGGSWRDRKFENNQLSHSSSRFSKIRDIERRSPNYRSGSVTNRWAHEAFKGEKNIFENIKGFKVPIALFQAGKESVVSNQKQTLFCEKVASCRLFHVSGAKHNILQEKDIFRSSLIQYVESTF